METFVSCMVGLITDPIKQYVVLPIKRHVSYAFTCDSKVQKLHHDMEQLDNKRVRLQQSVDEATRNGEQVYPNVTEWLTTAEKEIEEAEKLIQGKEEAKQKSWIGICPNLKTRYQLSKNADKKALAMDEQLQNAQGLDPIAFLPPPQPIVERSMYSREALPSRVLILNHIMDALKDQNLKTIGVYGMGGVGKTTLAKEVLGQAAEQKLFETVVLVAVSETPNLRRIQGEISDALGMKFRAEEVPGRASELHQRLKTAKVLIILDDVWQKLDLSAIGIPSEDASQGSKILLTSRKKDVLRSEMRTQTEFPLDVLKEEETLRLFEKSVSMGDDTELHALANEVANKCAGLPLLILKVATDLRNKDSYAWKDMLAQLSSLENTEIYEKVHKVIESSYEKLIDEEAKSLFLLCALFGSSNIQIRDLLIYCMGLGLFKRMVSIEGSRNRVLTLISKLKNESLLLDGDMDGYVKIHDVVRDIAAAIASKEHCAFVAKAQIESTDLERKDLRRISLPYCEIPKLPEVLQCPEAEVFSVFADDLSLHIPDSFFEGVTKLKVLDCYRVNFFSGLPSSICFLTGLQTLSLDGCSLNNVAMVAELKQLEVLSFAGSNVAELPRELKALTRLKLLDLSRCDDLRVIPSNVLSNLHLLEELYMLHSFNRWDTDGNGSLVELKNLSRLTTLEIRVPDGKLLPEDWFFNGIQNFKIFIGNWWVYDYGIRDASRMLKLELKTSFGLMDNSIKEFLGGTEVLYLREVNGIENLFCDSSREKKNSFQRLRYLIIDSCNSSREVLPFSKCLPHLHEIKVSGCENMEAIVGEGNDDGVMQLTRLNSLTLMGLPNLIGICRTASGTVSFPSLTSLCISRCNRLKYVFTSSMVKSLKQLKKLEIFSCDSMEEIIVVTECEEVAEFPELKELEIVNCDSLTNFASKDFDRSNNNESGDEYFFNNLVSLPNFEILNIEWMKNLRYLWHQQFTDKDSFSKLKSLEISECEKLSAVFTSNAVDDEAFSFENLQSVTVRWCPKLKYVIPTSIACGLVQLQRLEIFECGVEIITAEPKNEGSERASTCTFEWPKLTSLKIRNCDELVRFGGTVSFPSLPSLKISNCKSLKYVFTSSTVKSLKQLKKLKISSCDSMEEIIVVTECEEVAEFPELKELEIVNCDSLTNFASKDFDRSNSKAKHNIASQDSVYFIQKVIPNLEILTLDPQSLKAIQSDDHEFPSELLWKLKEVTVFKLEDESVPVLLDFLRGIYSLEKLAFKYCSLGERLSLLDGGAAGDQEQKHLHLFDVSKLKHIVTKDSQLDPNVQFLSFYGCADKMNIAPLSSSVSFKNLTTLHVYLCRKMTSLLTASTAKSMIHLMELQVKHCYMMEHIIVANEDGDCTEEHKDDVITFNKLKCLELHHLLELNSFCSGNYILNFPLLNQVSITLCNQMQIFCGGEVSTPELHLIQYELKTVWEGNLNATVASQFNRRSVRR